MGVHDCVGSFSALRALTEPHGRYGRLGGIHCAENKELLDAILRKEWGFDGIVISDW